MEDYAQPDVKLNYDSGTAGEYAGFDRFGRVVDHLWYDYGASADRDRFTYGYDRASSRLYRENTVASGKDEHYAYDDVNRLTVFDRGDLNANKDAITGTPVKEEDWGLDMTGNWSDFLQKTSGSTDLNQDRTHNPVNEITGITETAGTAWVDPVHDKAGNMTTLPKPSSLATGLTCKWDAWNRLVEVKQSATVIGRYEYDGLGRRAKSHVDSQSPANPNGVDAYVHFFYNQGWQELESRVSGSENTGPESLQPQYQYVWSRRYIDAPVLRDKNTDADGLCDDERLYYLGDANFNVTTLVNTGGDAVGTVCLQPVRRSDDLRRHLGKYSECLQLRQRVYLYRQAVGHRDGIVLLQGPHVSLAAGEVLSERFVGRRRRLLSLSLYCAARRTQWLIPSVSRRSRSAFQRMDTP